MGARSSAEADADEYDEEDSYEEESEGEEEEESVRARVHVCCTTLARIAIDCRARRPRLLGASRRGTRRQRVLICAPLDTHTVCPPLFHSPPSTHML